MNYTTLEAKLANLHHAELRAGVGALRARVRVLRYLGVPKVPKVGKGSRVEYSFTDLWESHFGLLLQEAGIPPTHVAEIIEQGRRDKQWEPRVSQLEQEISADVWVAITPVNRYAGAPAQDGFVSIVLGPFDALAPIMKKTWGRGALVYLLINLSQITRDCA
jgi:hypothetical protein